MLKIRLFKRFCFIVLFCIVCVGSVIGAGLPGDYLLIQRWRDLMAPYSPLTNPALLTEENYLSVRGAFTQILPGPDAFNLWETGITAPIGLDQSVGFSWIGEDDGQVRNYVSSTTGEILPNANYSTSSNTNSFFTATYAYNIWRSISAGANVNFAYQSNFSDGPTGAKPLMGLGLDLGVTWRALLHPVFGTHILGLTFQNLIAPSMSSSSILDFGHQGEYARDLRFSWLSNYWEHRIEMGLDFNLKDFLANDSDWAGNLVSASKQTEYNFNYRLGFNILRFINLFGLTGFSNAGMDYWGFAAGVNLPHVNNGRDFSFMYQFMSLTANNDNIISAPPSHTIYLRVQFGQHREEAYAERMARFVDLAPSELYNKACKLYFAGKYWDAFFVFSQIVVQYPNFFKNDWVKYYKASCLENLDMREASMENYEKAKQEFPRSSIIPYLHLGQMRLYYREDVSNSVYNLYALLNKPDVPDSLKYHAYYLMAETYLKQKNYQPAIELFSQVPETHPDYIFSQHSLATAQILSLKMEDALNALGNCIEAKAQTESQKEIVNRSYVLLGYIFYEQMALSKAVTALRMVPKSSYYFEDALLGLCWTALRARQWNDCVTMSQSLQKTTAKIPMQCDAGLIEGYANLMLKNYKQAFDILEAADGKAKAYAPPSADSLESQRNTYRTNRKDYATVANNVDNIAKELQSSYVLQQIDSLHRTQQGGKKLLDDFYHYVNEFGRQKFFSRNTDVIKGDIEYALAISQKLSQSTNKSDVQEQMQSKQKEIDQQIDKLKKEMNKLQDGKK
jgi:tetratricopeptide (TPR) repeat protein